MRNIISIQLETKVSLAIIAIVAIFFIALLYKSVSSFNKFIYQTNVQYEEVRIR